MKTGVGAANTDSRAPTPRALPLPVFVLRASSRPKGANRWGRLLAFQQGDQCHDERQQVTTNDPNWIISDSASATFMAPPPPSRAGVPPKVDANISLRVPLLQHLLDKVVDVIIEQHLRKLFVMRIQKTSSLDIDLVHLVLQLLQQPPNLR